MDFLCRKCNGRGFYLQEKGPNVGIYCDSCGSWNKWVGKKELPMLRRQGVSVLPAGAAVTLKNSKDLGVEKVDAVRNTIPMDLGTTPFGGSEGLIEKNLGSNNQDIEQEVERRVAERMKELEKSLILEKEQNISKVVQEPMVDDGYCPVCDGNPLESEGNSRVDVSIFSGVMTISDPEGFNIYGLYKLKRCPYCGKLF